MERVEHQHNQAHQTYFNQVSSTQWVRVELLRNYETFFTLLNENFL
jgi:hypothetical protein